MPKVLQRDIEELESYYHSGDFVGYDCCLDPRHRLRAVRRAPAANRAAVHRDPARAVKALLRACRPAVDRRGGRQHLERRARLVNVAEHGQAHQLVPKRSISL